MFPRGFFGACNTYDDSTARSGYLRCNDCSEGNGIYCKKQNDVCSTTNPDDALYMM